MRSYQVDMCNGPIFNVSTHLTTPGIFQASSRGILVH